MSPVLPVQRTVVAHNYATDSENRIHADDVAQQFGFRGGLVPGVSDYGYLARTVALTLGEGWLSCGWMEAKFIKPVYDGDTVTARLTEPNASDHLLTLELIDGNGALCAVGRAGDEKVTAYPDSDWFDPALLEPGPLPHPKARTLARIERLPSGTQFGSLSYSAAATHQWHADSPERFAEAGSRAEADGRTGDQLLHPAFVPEVGNEILMQNTLLGPWIHTASRVRHLSPLRAGDELEVRGCVAETACKKGRESVELNVGVYQGGDCCAQLVHAAIVHLPT